MTRAELELVRDPRLAEEWYYSIELAPGVVTPGKAWPNVALTRLALGATDVRGRSCIDIGTQEGVVPTLLARRGAGRVVAQDSQDRAARIDLVRSALGVEFDYLGGVRLDAVRSEAQRLGAYPFDVVVFAGVLYHLHDPIAGLAHARGLLTNGGIMVVETIVAIDRSMALHFNAEGKPLGFTGSYFLISVTCLDYLLRLMRLQIVDCLTLRAIRRGSHKLARMCAVCRGLDDWHPGNEDEWMKVCAQTFASPRFRDPSIVWQELATDREPVAYAPVNERRVLRKATGDVDLYRTVRRSKPIGARATGLLELGLDDQY